MAIPSLATVGGQQFPVGYPGQLAMIGATPVIETRINEGATALDFGGAAVQGVAVAPGNPGNCKLPVSGGVVVGLIVRALSEANTAVSAGTVNYPQYHDVPILTDGYIFCTAAEAVTEGDAAVCVVATPATMGGATGGAANGTTRLAVPGAIWKQTVASGAVGVVRIVTQ